MPIATVPANAQPGVISTETLFSLESICDVGSLEGVRNRSVSAWVQVCITPFGEVAPDAWGRYFHVCIEFAQPEQWLGKRRMQVPAWSTIVGPGSFYVECDPAWYWIGSWAKFWGTGGRSGDKYNVTMTVATMQQESDARLSDGNPPFYQVDVFEPACLFQLTSMSMADINNELVALPGIADHHGRFWLHSGTATWGGIPVVAGGKSLPLNAPIATGTNTIYMTGGGV
jgi:hypothetical protein